MEGSWPHVVVVYYQKKAVTVAECMYPFMDNKSMIKKVRYIAHYLTRTGELQSIYITDHVFFFGNKRNKEMSPYRQQLLASRETQKHMALPDHHRMCYIM